MDLASDLYCKDTGEITQEPIAHFLQVAGSGTLSLYRRYSPVMQSTGDNVVEVRKIGADIDRYSVLRDAGIYGNSNCRDLFVANPYTGRTICSVAFDSVRRKKIDRYLLK